MDFDQQKKPTSQSMESKDDRETEELMMMKLEEGCAIRDDIEGLFEADGLTFTQPEDES